MVKFNNFKAVTSGVLGAINEDTEIAKKKDYTLDIMRQKAMLDLDVDKEKEAQKEKYLQTQHDLTSSANRDALSKVLGVQTPQALAQADQSQVVQGATAPTTEQDAAQSTNTAISPPPTNGGLNSPQGGPVPLSSAPAQASTPSKTPLQAGNQDIIESPVATAITSEDKTPNEDYIHRVSAEQARLTSGKKGGSYDATAVALQAKLNVDNGIDELNTRSLTNQKVKADISEKEPSIIYKDDKILKKEADKAGLPYNRDPVLAEMSRGELIKNRQADAKALEKIAEPVVSDAKDSIGRLNSIVGLNKYVETGGTSALPGVTEMRTSLDSSAAEMQKDIAYITLRNRPSSGYSRVTNVDLATFKQASPNLGIPNEANYVIAAGLMADKMDTMAYWRFRQNWVNRYGGDDAATIDKLWDSYKDANPIFDPKGSPEAPVFNKDRKTPEEFFRGKSTDDILAERPASTVLPSSINETQTPDYSSLWMSKPTQK